MTETTDRNGAQGTATAESTSQDRLVADLNDLLQLDHDAVEAYTIAIKALDTSVHRDTLRRFRGDHERHIDDLTTLIHARGGTPVQLPHVPSGAFKLAVQGAGAVGDDRAVVLAFKANERQVRDKYERAARARHPADVTQVLARNAEDEKRHYAWAVDALRRMGVEPDSTMARGEEAFERVHAKAADAMELGEKQGMLGAMRVGRAVQRAASNHPVRSAAIVLGAVVLAAKIFRDAG